MANEISITLRLQVSKTSAGTLDCGSSTVLKFDLSGDDIAKQGMNVTQAADVQIPIPSGVATVGLLYVKNLDSTNYIEISTGTGGSFAAGVIAKVRKGFPALFQPPSATLYAKANTADCRIEWAAIDE